MVEQGMERPHQILCVWSNCNSMQCAVIKFQRSYGTNYERKGSPNTLSEAFFQIKFQVKFVSIIPHTNVEENQSENNQKTHFYIMFFISFGGWGGGPKHPLRGIFFLKKFQVKVVLVGFATTTVNLAPFCHNLYHCSMKY